MKSWFVLTGVNLFIPVVIIVVGLVFLKKTPKCINHFFGYRTRRSMKSQSSWEFAHRLIGKIWLVAGFLLLPISVIPMLFIIEKSEETLNLVGMAVCYFEVAVLVVTIIPVELALKKNFDEEGNRKVIDYEKNQ